MWNQINKKVSFTAQIPHILILFFLCIAIIKFKLNILQLFTIFKHRYATYSTMEILIFLFNQKVGTCLGIFLFF